MAISPRSYLRHPCPLDFVSRVGAKVYAEDRAAVGVVLSSPLVVKNGEALPALPLASTVVAGPRFATWCMKAASSET